MASVFIDIPGVGNVEAKNAATEATLKEILKVMQGVQKNTGGKGAGGNNNSGSPGGNNTQTSGLAKAAGAAGKGLGSLAKTAGLVVGGFDVLSKVTTGVIQSFANVGDSVESAASLFKGIPIVGSMFTAVAGAAAKVTKAYTESTAAGATFGGSMQNFSRAASTAGMTMDNFGRMISQNGEALTAFGSTTESGANRFAAVSKELRNTSGGLYALGYSTEEINQGLANYGKTIKMQGRQGTMTNAELVAGSKKYLQEMDLLAKVTGETRKQQEDARAKLLQDAQVQAKVDGMSKEAGEAFMNTINGLPPGLRDVAKDIMVTGTATTEEAQKFSSLMPRSAELMRKYAEVTDKGGTVTKAMQQELQNTMAMEGKAAKAQYATVGKYNKEFATTYNQMSQAAGMNKDALTDAEKAQLKAQEETDAMNKRMQEAQQTLAKFSNGFQMALVNSGVLDLLMKTFGMVATFVQNTVVPGFFLLAGIVTTIGGILINTLEPAFKTLGEFIANDVYPIFQTLAAFFIDHVIPGIMKAVNDLLPVFVAIGETLLPPLIAIGEFIFDNLTPILIGLGIGLAAYGAMVAAVTVIGWAKTAMDIAQAAAQLPVVAGLVAMAGAVLAATWPILAVVAAATALWMIFKKFGGDVEVVKDGLKFMWSGFESFFSYLKLGFLKVLDYLPGVDMKDKIAETENEIADQKVEREKLAEQMSSRMSANRTQAALKEAEEDAKNNKTKNALDLKNIKEQQKNSAGLEAANKKQAEEQQKKLDLNANENDLLVQFAQQQGSAYIKDKPAASAAASTGTAAITTEADQKKAAAEAAAKKEEETAKAKAETSKGGSGAPAPSTQESPASLLASLNTKMDQLIKHAAVTQSNTYETYRATNGLTGNLYKSV
jgi:hypothetical protein